MRRILSIATVLSLFIVTGCVAGSNPEPTPAVKAIQTDSDMSPKDLIFAARRHEGKLTVRYLDLQSAEPSGDSIVVQSPDGKTLLIDAGTPSAGSQVVQYLDKLGVDRIDIAVNTHPHPDHIGGFESVFRAKPTDLFYMIHMKPAAWSSYTNTMSVVQSKKIKQEYLEAGMQFQLGKEVLIEVLNPRKGELPDTVSHPGEAELDEVNNASMVLLLTYRNNRFLFTGDIHRDREAELITSSGDKLRADFMDAPHHGITTSSSQSFLKAVSPKIAVISYNKFSNFKQLLTYQRVSKNAYVTALHGNILITSDGTELAVWTEKEYPPQGNAPPSSK